MLGDALRAASNTSQLSAIEDAVTRALAKVSASERAAASRVLMKLAELQGTREERIGAVRSARSFRGGERPS